jgi:carboxyl-terminal processing protease
VEAVELAGILLDSGPLCIYRTNHEKPTLIKDLGRGALYSGPLVLLINGYSASASELLAMILQDHNRALVVGTPSFGKASGQIILPLAEPDNNSRDQYFFGFEPKDYLKVTTTRYYRLDGTSPQSTGIKPDVQLPVHAGFSKIKESAYPTALKNDSVCKDIRFDPLPALPGEKLLSKSNERIAMNPNFIMFNALNDSIRPLYKSDFRIPLEIEAFYLDYKRNSAFFKGIDQLKASPNETYRIEEHTMNQDLLRKDTYLQEVHEEIIENLVKDFYLEETYRIMNDLIKYKDNNGEHEW